MYIPKKNANGIGIIMKARKLFESKTILDSIVHWHVLIIHMV